MTKFKNNQILLNKIRHRISTDNQAIYWLKEPHYQVTDTYSYPELILRNWFQKFVNLLSKPDNFRFQKTPCSIINIALSRGEVERK